MASTSEFPQPHSETNPLGWLAAQPEYPKVLDWDRDRGEWAAGAGAAALYAAPDAASTAEIERELARRAAAEPADGPGWIGGIRFAPERSASAATARAWPARC